MSSESKRDRFVRIAEQRTQKVLDALHALSKCASTANYEYTDDEVEQILTAIEKGVREARDTFAGRNRFTLSDKPDPNEKEVVET